MAIKPMQHTIIENHNISENEEDGIYAGMPVYIDSTSGICIWDSGAQPAIPLGLAADDRLLGLGINSPVGSYIWLDPVSLNYMAIDDDGNKRTGRKIWVNETIASSKISVFVGQGRFLTDQYRIHADGAWTPYCVLWSDAAGQLYNVVGAHTWHVARLVRDKISVYTRVPGTNLGVIEIQLDVDKD